MPIITPPYLNPWFPNTFNFNPGVNLQKWRAALARVKAGTGSGKVVFVGDSTTFGVGTTGSTTVGNMRPLSVPAQFSNRLNNFGINAHWNSFAGSGNTFGSLPTVINNDSRVVAGNSWGLLNNAFQIIGGTYLTASTNTNAFSFTPTTNVDTFTFYYPTAAGFGTIQYDLNGGSATVIPENAATGFHSSTATTTLGSNTINVKWNASTACYFIGIEAFDSTKQWISCVNAGWSGARATQWAASTVAGTIGVFSQDLTVINLGINDWEFGNTVAQYTTAMQTIITACKAVGDVILVSPNPSNPAQAGISNATQLTYINALYSLAAINNVPLVDYFNRVQSYTNANFFGLDFDNVHPNTAGYSDMTQQIFNLLGAP